MLGMYLSNIRDYLRSEGFTKDISPICITDIKKDPYFGLVQTPVNYGVLLAYGLECSLTTFSDHPVADESGDIYRTAEHCM